MILATLLLAAATSSGVASLATVPGLSVSVEHTPPALAVIGATADALRAHVEARLRAATLPADPCCYLYVHAEGLRVRQGLVWAVTLQILQPARIADAGEPVRVTTWETGQLGFSATPRLQDVLGSLDGLLDTLLHDFDATRPAPRGLPPAAPPLSPNIKGT